jgi:NADP-dependent aldehyde dehydrogenase
MLKLTGTSMIGFRRGEARGPAFHGLNPATGEALMPAYASASTADVDEAAQLASQAFAVYGRASGRAKAAFLRKIAENIGALGEALVERVRQETALPAARVQTEAARTCHQLRLFADVVEEGSWVDARIDRADPSRQPVPKPDVRSMLRPLGVVAVFGASNFPLAFSVAGGDTASALASGCPVIVKAHPAHPGTSELVGGAVQDAVRECRLPEGVFSLLFDGGYEIGVALVTHPLIKAVGFTGSRPGGLALMRAAAARPEPVPFYAEMSSVNPVFILPGAMRERRDHIAAGLHTSVMLGAGQFCTKPGLVVMGDDSPAKAFAEKLGELMDGSPACTMLTPGISAAYRGGVAARAQQATAMVRRDVENGCQTGAALFQTDAASYLAAPELGAEIFGPTTLLVASSDREQMLEIARALEGHLTATVHGTEDDLGEFSELLAILETKVGRLVFNGFPTGVEVCPAMVHGGPFPATSDGRWTSVGTRAIVRFARLVCYQNFPDAALPDELKNGNPLGLRRLVDGSLIQ